MRTKLWKSLIIFHGFIDDFDSDLVLENIVGVDKNGHLPDYPQFGRFEEGKRVGIYTKMIE